MCIIMQHQFFLEPLNTVKNLRVYDPTTSTLNVRWEPAEGNVRQYKVFYVPTAGGPEEVVNTFSSFFLFHSIVVLYLQCNRNKHIGSNIHFVLCQ